MFSLPFVRDFTVDLGENSELLSVIVGAALIGASGVPVVKRGATFQKPLNWIYLKQNNHYYTL